MHAHCVTHSVFFWIRTTTLCNGYNGKYKKTKWDPSRGEQFVVWHEIYDCNPFTFSQDRVQTGRLLWKTRCRWLQLQMTTPTVSLKITSTGTWKEIWNRKLTNELKLLKIYSSSNIVVQPLEMIFHARLSFVWQLIKVQLNIHTGPSKFNRMLFT